MAVGDIDASVRLLTEMNSPTEEIATGPRYLELVTRLQHRVRLADPLAGVWEAADFQWWWRRARPSDAGGQLFWLDAAGDPVAAIVFTAWSDELWQCDVLEVPDLRAVDLEVMWRRALERMRALDLRLVEVPCDDGDTATVDILVSAGFEPSDPGVSCWLAAGSCPDITPLAEGIVLKSRADDASGPHPMVARNGPAIAERLSHTSLYRADLDLRVESTGGELAGYGLFWADPVTGVGLVEPMRTEAEFERRGIAHHVLTAGLTRLVASGCDRLKVSSDGGLYSSVGFAPVARNQILRREGGWS